MPTDLTTRPAETRTTRPVQIAQEGGPRQTGTEAATTQPAEKKYDPGKPGDPYLLFYNSLLVVALMILFALSARKSLQKIPKGFSNFAEWVAECLNTFTVSIIGPGGERFTPLIGTIFLYILLMNLIGLIPGFHSPTANLTFTLTMGISVFIYVQYIGIRNNGVGGHIMHFMGPKLGKYPLAAPLMFPVELLSELFRPLTLAIRLFGNIFGEDVIMFVLAGLGAASLASAWVPFHLPILLLALLTSLVQAMVFATLSCIYIALVSHHEEEHHDDHQDHHAPGAHETAPAQATH